MSDGEFAASEYAVAVYRKQLSGADYLASRGVDGLDALRALVAQTEARDCAESSGVAYGVTVDDDKEPAAPLPKDWHRAVPLAGACMNGQLASLHFLVDEARVAMDAIDAVTGDTALHVAVVWGRIECVAWMLARGARADVADKDGLDVAAAARRRQRLLERGDEAFAEKLRARGMDIDALRVEGVALVKMLDAVKALGGWKNFADANSSRPRVARAAPWVKAARDRNMFAVSRALATRPGQPVPAPAPPKEPKRLSKAKRAAAEDAAAKDAAEALKAGDPGLGDALVAAGLVSEAPGEKGKPHEPMLRALRWLDCKTVDDARDLGRDDVAKVDGPTPAERRRLWLFIADEIKKRDVAVAAARGGVEAKLRREADAARRANRPVDPRAAIAWRVPGGVFQIMARFLYHALPPPLPPPPLPDHLLCMLDGIARNPPSPVAD